jgi:hypothetical protein
LRDTAVKNAGGTLPPGVPDIDTILPPDELEDESDLINDVTLDLSAATIEAEAVEFDEAAAQERVPHADPSFDAGNGNGNGAGIGDEIKVCVLCSFIDKPECRVNKSLSSSLFLI